MQGIDDVLRRRKVPTTLGQRVRAFYNYVLHRQLGDEESMMMQGD